MAEASEGGAGGGEKILSFCRSYFLAGNLRGHRPASADGGRRR